MNQDITLVILAAGMGSRFGGLKQIAPMGPNDEFIIDYSVYDAIEAGFTKIVFLIKTRYRIISNYIIYLLLLFYLVNKTRLLPEMFFRKIQK